MKNHLNNFYSLLPEEIKKLVLVLNEKGIRVGFIGGITRDFLLYNTISHDVDLELRSESDIDMYDLCDSLGGEINTEYNIITLKFSSCNVELGLPRIESFKGEQGHKNFSFIHTKGYQREFLRRDFTINAILFEYFFDDIKFFDPLNGFADIQSKTLRACSNDFNKDPVRMLRAFRFQVSKGLSFHKSLEVSLSNMKLSDCNSFYILKEATSSKRPLSFLNSIGLIDSYSEHSIYNTEKFTIKEILERDPSIDDKVKAIKTLGISLKNLLPISKKYLKIQDCLDLFKYIIKNKLSIIETQFIFDYFKIDTSSYKLEAILELNLNLNTKGLSPSEKDRAYMELILNGIKL